MPHRPTLLPQRPVPRAAGLPSGVGSGIGLSLGVGLGLLVGLPGLGLAPAPALARPFPRALAQQPPPQERGASEPGGLPATVLSVGDGDTLRVNQAGQVLTIRLACIDAPEMAQRPWGEASRAYLQARLPRGTTVSLLLHTIDRYGRTVAEVIHEININLVLVEDGQAFAYRQYLGGCKAKEYLDAEFRASRRRFGVWQVEGGITRPWDFRRQRRGVVPGDDFKRTPKPVQNEQAGPR